MPDLEKEPFNNIPHPLEKEQFKLKLDLEHFLRHALPYLCLYFSARRNFVQEMARRNQSKIIDIFYFFPGFFSATVNLDSARLIQPTQRQDPVWQVWLTISWEEQYLKQLPAARKQERLDLVTNLISDYCANQLHLKTKRLTIPYAPHVPAHFEEQVKYLVNFDFKYQAPLSES